MKKIISMALVLSSLQTWAQQNVWKMKTYSYDKCLAGDTSAENQFSCCVKNFQYLELRDENTLSIAADPQLCANPILQNIDFKFSERVPSNGLKVYHLLSPSINETPFNSKTGRTTHFWLNVMTYFKLPAGHYGSDFYPFVVLNIGVDEYQMPGLSDRTFGHQTQSELGWKKKSEKIISSQKFSSACPPPFHRRQCQYQTDEYQEVWTNQKTGEDTSRMVKNPIYLGFYD